MKKVEIAKKTYTLIAVNEGRYRRDTGEPQNYESGQWFIEIPHVEVLGIINQVIAMEESGANDNWFTTNDQSRYQKFKCHHVNVLINYII